MSATDFLRRARIATQAFADVANWREVLPLAATGKAVTEIRLRSGAVIKAYPDGSLWPVFSDTWYHHSYTKHCTIPPESTVVDVGANVGVFSLFAAPSLAPYTRSNRPRLTFRSWSKTCPKPEM